MQSRGVFYLVPFVLALALAGGCGKSDDKKATQVAAKVNSDEITVHQIDNVLARTPNITAENASIAKKQILDRLI
jgi:EpsD family peptidyl-prolyl cis-trans isomerase